MALPNREGDWDWAQVQYETTSKPADVIGQEIGVTATSVISRASRYGWTRNRAISTINTTAEMALAARLSNEEKHRLNMEAIEKVNQLMQAEVLANHRKDIKRARDITNDIFDSLAADMGDHEHARDHEHASKTLQRLATSLKTFILLERQAYGIVGAIVDPEEQTPDSIPASALNTILDKFASVIQKGQQSTPQAPMADVVEMPK